MDVSDMDFPERPSIGSKVAEFVTDAMNFA
jgi:hypothetical protein